MLPKAGTVTASKTRTRTAANGRRAAPRFGRRALTISPTEAPVAISGGLTAAASVAPAQAEMNPITSSVARVRIQPVGSKDPRAPVAERAFCVSAMNV